MRESQGVEAAPELRRLDGQIQALDPFRQRRIGMVPDIILNRCLDRGRYLAGPPTTPRVLRLKSHTLAMLSKEFCDKAQADVEIISNLLLCRPGQDRIHDPLAQLHGISTQ
jgi:hypothetical protein